MKEPSNLPKETEHPLYVYELLTLEKAAEILGVPPRVLKQWTYGNRFPDLKFVKLGRYRQFPREELMEFIKLQEEETANKVSKRHSSTKEEA
ncbi:MAG: helix-turn-helix domain-containing protein [Puniceicoccales bacterium]|jgi:excisionase family DNA binding protein|nr:helix-turn-helix domain-containing protein [Puniceicoccales bacterium]